MSHCKHGRASMKYEFLFLFISLFCLCSPFKILFNCGTEEELPNSLWESFQLSPLENLEMAKQVVHYLPFSFGDFVTFLYRTSKIDRTAIDADKSPAFAALFNLVTSPSFQSFFQSANAASLEGQAIQDEAAFKFGSCMEEQNKARFQLYAEFWSEYNYLYPLYYRYNFGAEENYFAGGVSAACYRVVNFLTSGNELSFNLPQKAVFKHLTNVPMSNSTKKYGFTYLVDLSELKISLFHGLFECPSIHILSCLVVSSKEHQDNNSNAMGFLSESAIYGSLRAFITKNTITGNYVPILKGLLQVAEAIHILHQNEIVHNDMQMKNILVFGDEKNNNCCFKLTDFGASPTFTQYLDEFKHVVKENDETALTANPNLKGQETFLKKKIVFVDWRCFAFILNNIWSFIDDYAKLNFVYLAELSTILHGNEYWDQENILQLIKEHIDKEIEACRINKLFRVNLK